MQLHFGLKKRYSLPFDNCEYNLVYEPYMRKSLKFKLDGSDPGREFPMVLEHKLMPKGRLVLLLKQTFNTWAPPVDKTKSKLLFATKQKVSKKTGYYYRWTFKGDTVTISKMIGTTNVNQLKKQAEELVRECQRFIFCYCQG